MIKSRTLVSLAFAAALVLAGLYWFAGTTGKNQSRDTAPGAAAGASLKALATGPMAAFLAAEPPRDIAAFTFMDGTGADKTLADFKGRVVLLNLWATWCAPCRKEMPDLARLQKEMGSADFEVVALSLDRKGAEASSAFLKETGADNLALYTDVESKALAAVSALGLPATLLVDRNGKEAGRLLGPADWASPEAKSLIQSVLAH
jgi:thiol-disulfide isomerase/thioredoxin